MTRHTSVLATIAAAAVGAASVLLFVRPGSSDTPNMVVARPAAAQTSTKSIGGKGIPPSPDYTYSAPAIPTENLRTVANALHLSSKSVTVVVTVPAGLAVTNRLDISLRYGTEGQHVTQPYNSSAGNRLVANLPDGNGSKRREEVTVDLIELTAGGTVEQYALKYPLDLEPRYDISLGHFHAYLYNDCDSVGDSEPHIYWRSPDGKARDVEVSMSAGEDVPVSNLAETFTAVGQSANLKRPVFRVWEEDFDGLEFHGGLYTAGVTPLLPGNQTRAIEGVFVAENDNSCRIKLSYRITYTLRQYPNL